MMQMIRVCDNDGGVERVSRQILHCVCARANKCVNACTTSAYASVSGCTQHVIFFCILLVCVCMCARIHRFHLKVNVVGAVGGLGTANVWFHSP